MSKVNRVLLALAACLGSMVLMAYLALLARWVRPDPPGRQEAVDRWVHLEQWEPRVIRGHPDLVAARVQRARRGRMASEADEALRADAVRRANRVL